MMQSESRCVLYVCVCVCVDCRACVHVRWHSGSCCDAWPAELHSSLTHPFVKGEHSQVAATVRQHLAELWPVDQELNCPGIQALKVG